MLLLKNEVTLNAVLFQADNTCESSKDVTQREVIVDIMNYSTAFEVKPISIDSSKTTQFKNEQCGFVTDSCCLDDLRTLKIKN